jgi:alkylation response protein AidB-like acyl-CoA dehydrogenase
VYPTLRFRDDQWVDRTVAELAAFAVEHAAELHEHVRACRFPRDLFAEMGRRGWAGALVPQAYGGGGGGPAEYSLIAEEIGRHGLVSIQTSAQGQLWLLDWGTEEQKDAYLPGLASGEIVFAEAISEPGVGSSLKLMQATARRDPGGDWILEGRKTHVNLGEDCDLMIVYAVVPDEGLTAFLVERSLPGVLTRKTDPIGLRLIPTADVELNRVRVPKTALLGPVGGGLKTFFSTFNVSRIGNAAELIGLGRRALAEALDYARERQVGENLVVDFQGIRWTVADAYMKLYGAALARDLAANHAAAGKEIALETSLAKRLAIDAAEYAANECFALVGGHGLYHDRAFAQILDDIKVLRVAGGSSEVLRNLIARRVVDDPAYGGLR